MSIYEPDLLFLPDELIYELAEQQGTPFYIYDAQGLRTTAADLREVFSCIAGHRQFFPLKVNPAPGVLKALLQSGLGLLCTTDLELEMALRAGAKAEQILFSPVITTEATLRKVCNEKIMLVIDSEQMLDQLLRAGTVPETVGLRLHPKDGIRVGTKLIARTEGLKFGMDLLDLVKVAVRLEHLGVKQVGLHCHVKGYISNVRYWAQILKALHEAAQKIRAKTGLLITYYDVGGGLEASKLPAKEMFSQIAALLQETTQNLGIDAPIYTEFGRCVSGPHGILVSRVAELKPFFDETRELVILDTGITKLMRHVVSSTEYYISVVGKREIRGRKFYSLCGPLSDRNDYIRKKYQLSELQVGDLVAIHGTGAYAASMQSAYAGQLCCAEYIYDNGSLHLLTKAQTQEEYFSRFTF